MPTLRLATLALLLLAGCGANADSLDGERLYVHHGCSTCHGPAGAGGPLGPALTSSSEHWDRESLTAFLADPRGTIAGDERLEELDRRFRTQMPPFRGLSEDRLHRIADFVLSLR